MTMGVERAEGEPTAINGRESQMQACGSLAENHERLDSMLVANRKYCRYWNESHKCLAAD
jgi:hypothetical protein